MSSSYSLLFIYENAKQNRLTDHKLVWSIMLTAHGCVYTRKLNDKNFWLTNLINWTQRVVWVNKWTPRVWHISTKTRIMIDYFHLSIANIFSSVWSDVKKATISFLHQTRSSAIIQIHYPISKYTKMKKKIITICKQSKFWNGILLEISAWCIFSKKSIKNNMLTGCLPNPSQCISINDTIILSVFGGVTMEGLVLL